MKKRLAILGSTGSIGTKALEVIDQHPELFSVEILSAHSNADLVIEQAKKYTPNAVVITDEVAFEKVKKELASQPIKVFFGHDALIDVVGWETVDLVLVAILGFTGVHAVFAAIEAGKPIALANKETLVVAGELVMQKVKEKNGIIIPVDSEHSAIFQCLIGEQKKTIEKIVLTASGGPFLGKKTNFLVNVKKDHALQHTNYQMGEKIAIDSASLMNKGLEMIEAKWLFELENDQIDVIIHPQSIVHSIVQYIDGSLKAQMGLPDMKLPIQYALSYPQRISNTFKRLDFKEYSTFTFEAPDYKTFKNLVLAKEAMFKGGNMPCILHAANEVVVHAFLQNKVGFIEMSEIIENVMSKTKFIEHPTLEELEQTDAEARKHAGDLAKFSQLYGY